jgi:3-hydroxyacyl-CoA dehydrogenase
MWQRAVQPGMPALLPRLADAGMLGKKTGRGFYDDTELTEGSE